GLEGVIAVVGAAAVVVDALRPAERVPQWLALPDRHVGVAGRGRLVRVHIWHISGAGMGALVTDIADLERPAVADLVLDGQVIGVDGGQPLLRRQSRGDDPVGQRKAAAGRNLGKHWQRRPVSQIEDAVESWRRYGLDREDRKVLGDAVTEGRAEDADVVAAPVAHPYDR